MASSAGNLFGSTTKTQLATASLTGVEYGGEIRTMSRVEVDSIF